MFTRGLTDPQLSEPESSLDPSEWEGWEVGVIDNPQQQLPFLSSETNGETDIISPVWHKDPSHQKEKGQEATAEPDAELAKSGEAEGTADTAIADLSPSEKASPSPVTLKLPDTDSSTSRRGWPVWTAIASAALLLLVGGAWVVTSFLGDENPIAAGSKENGEKATQLYEESVRSYQEGNKDQAVELAEQAVERNPKEKGHLLYLANLYGEQKQYDKGVRLLQEGVKQIPAAEVYDALAVHAYYAEDWKEAERGIDRALSLEPNNPQFLYHQGKIQGAQGDTTAAIRSLQFAIDQDRNNALYHHDRALFLRQEGDLERAKNYAWRAAKLQPEQARYWITAGNIYLADRERVLKDKKLSSKERRFESLTLARHAINFYSEALELKPDDARTHYRISIAHYYNEDMAAAEKSADQAIKLDPNRALHHYQRGVVLAKQGDLEQAEESLQKAREIDPDNRRYQQALNDLK